MSAQKPLPETEAYLSYLSGKPIAKTSSQPSTYEQQDLALRERFLEDFHKIARYVDLLFWMTVTVLIFGLILTCLAIFSGMSVWSAINNFLR